MYKDNTNLFNINLILISLFPLFVFLGPFFENFIFIAYFILCLIILIKKNLYFEKSLLMSLFLFYFFILLSGTISQNYDSIVKSILYILYLLPIIFFYTLKFDKNNFKTISYVFIFFILILSFDLIIQKIVGYNIFGMPLNECYDTVNNNIKKNCRPSSFFGDELVAGSFIAKFSFIPILITMASFDKIKINKITFLFLFYILGLFAIYLTGERMAFLIHSLFFLVFIILISFKYKKLIILFLCLLIFLFIALLSQNNYGSKRLISIFSNLYSKDIVEIPILTHGIQEKETITNLVIYDEYLNDFKIEKNAVIGKIQIKRNYYEQCNEETLQVCERNKSARLFKVSQKNRNLKIINYKKNFNNTSFYVNASIFEKDLNELEYEDFRIFSKDKIVKTFLDTGWGAHVQASFEIFKSNYLFGIGLKNFSSFCDKLPELNIYEDKKKCTNHPHNYFIELLTSLGLIGLFLFLFLIFKLFQKFFMYNHNNKLNFIFFITIFIIINPIQITGSIAGSSFANKFWMQIYLILIFINSFVKENE